MPENLSLWLGREQRYTQETCREEHRRYIHTYIYMHARVHTECVVWVINAIRIHRKEIVRSGGRLELKREHGTWSLCENQERRCYSVRQMVSEAPRGCL